MEADTFRCKSESLPIQITNPSRTNTMILLKSSSIDNKQTKILLPIIILKIKKIT